MINSNIKLFQSFEILKRIETDQIYFEIRNNLFHGNTYCLTQSQPTFSLWDCDGGNLDVKDARLCSLFTQCVAADGVLVLVLSGDAIFLGGVLSTVALKN